MIMDTYTIDHIRSDFLQFLKNRFQLADEDTQACSVTINADTQEHAYGDINSNAALVLAKRIGDKPINIAETIASEFQHDALSEIHAAPPGFINMHLTQNAFVNIAQSIYQYQEHFFTTSALGAEQHHLEYVSANPTGPLHFGHGRGAIIGDVLARIFQFQQIPRTREYYVNDAGQQMHKLGMSLYYRCRQEIEPDIELPEDAYHGAYLIELARKLVNTHGHAVVNNPYSFFAQHARDVLLDHIRNTLDAYRVTYDVWFSEQSLHNDYAVKHAVKTLTQRGYTYEDAGALWFRATDFGDDKDRVLQRSDGDYTYMAADVAYMQHKYERGYTQLIMILGQDHHSYVDRLKAAAQALGYDPNTLYVILYQMVSLEASGQEIRMSKRTGNIVTLQDIIDTVGTDAARYFYLNKKANAHLTFDVDLAQKQSEENPVFYIQYAYVRTRSIFEKARTQLHIESVTPEDLAGLDNPERGLIRKIMSLKPLLRQIQQNYQTHLLAHYVYELAHAFHSYYGSYKIVDSQKPKQTRMRLALLSIIRSTLGTCLDLLGVTKPETM